MYLLDSNILIYARDPKNRFLDEYVVAEGAAVSEISLGEVLAFPGLNERQEKDYEIFISLLRMLPVDREIWVKAAKLCRESRCKLADGVIAATALEYQLILVTRNTKDFKGIKGLKTVDPFGRLEA